MTKRFGKKWTDEATPQWSLASGVKTEATGTFDKLRNYGKSTFGFQTSIKNSPNFYLSPIYLRRQMYVSLSTYSYLYSSSLECLSLLYNEMKISLNLHTVHKTKEGLGCLCVYIYISRRNYRYHAPGRLTDLD